MKVWRSGFGVGSMILISFITIIIVIALYKNYTITQKSQSLNQKNIGNTFTLPLHKQIKIPQTDIFLQLLEVEAPDQNCRDCIEYAKIRVSKNSEVRELEFKSGGIVGYTLLSQEVFGYIVTIEKFSDDSVVLHYKKWEQ